MKLTRDKHTHNNNTTEDSKCAKIKMVIYRECFFIVACSARLHASFKKHFCHTECVKQGAMKKYLHKHQADCLWVWGFMSDFGGCTLV